jgi:AraC-like DNA-binding protein/quercetin dioxygenase-like cupin family protein
MHISPHLFHETPQTLVQIVRAGAYFAPKGKDYPLHTNEFWELHYYRAGNVKSIVDGERIEVHPGMAVLVPPGVIHGEEALTAYANYYVLINIPDDASVPRVIYDDPGQSLLCVCAACVRELRLHSDPYQAVMLQALALQLTVLLTRIHHNNSLSNAERLVRSVEQYFEENFASSVTVEHVAREMNVSASYLRKLFKSHRDETPKDCLQRIRLRHALAWLRTSDLTLEAIADACGYDSASHLSRHVRQALGKSPGHVRKQHRGRLPESSSH